MYLRNFGENGRIAMHLTSGGEPRIPERDLSLRDYVLSGAREVTALEAELARLEQAMAEGWLYGQPEMRAEIERLRVIQRDPRGGAQGTPAVVRAALQRIFTRKAGRGALSRSRSAPRASSRVLLLLRAAAAALRQRLHTVLDKNRRLREETAQLKHELALAYGQRRDWL
jgi:hypothetical protein